MSDVELGAFSASLSTTDTPLTVSWHDIRVSLPVKATKKGATTEEKVLLNSVSGCAPAGTLTAIMGPSGAGKTTLLNAIVGLLPPKSTATGAMRLNGKPFSSSYWRRVHGFVWQEDVMFGNLTVRETLLTSARLRVPNMTKAEHEALVDSIVDELGLQSAINTKIGTPTVKGVSGGEKKRTSVGIELITNPRVLIADEPTSGLDAASALAVMRTLKSLADAGRTVICTIHQPRSKIVDMLDSVILLSRGEVAYSGPTEGAIGHFAELGYELPPRTNPVDFYLDMVNPGSESAVKAVELWDSKQKGDTSILEGTNVTEVVQHAKEGELLTDAEVELPSAFAQFRVLLWRGSKNMYRDRLRTVVRVIQSLIFGAIVGLIFFDLGVDQVGISDRLGALYFLMLNQSFSSLFPVLMSFTDEKDIFRKERGAGFYRAVWPYFMSKLTVEFPMSFVPVVFGAVIYYIVGFNSSASAFFWFLLTLYLLVFSVEGAALTISALSKDTQMAQAIAPVYIILMMLASGFIINVDSLPSGIAWLQYISFMKFGYEALVTNEFAGQPFECSPGEFVESSGGSLVCPVTNGDAVIAQRGFDEGNFGISLLGLIIQGVLFRFLTYLILVFLVKSKTSQRLGQRDVEKKNA